jgi:hypothetical protein
MGLPVKATSANVAGGKVRALFDLRDPSIGPFPSDQFTVADASHITGRRVNLPLPDCAMRPTDCEDVGTVNRLDGFNVQPRLTVAFDGAIDPASVTSDSLFLLQLTPGSPSTRIGINQLVWDPARLVAVPEADQLLDQHSEFVLVATNGITDTNAKSVLPSAGFQEFLEHGTGHYHDRLVAGMAAVRQSGVPVGRVVTASVFTTMSVTSILEKIRRQLDASRPESADFLLGPSGSRTVFDVSAVRGITLREQSRVAPPAFVTTAVQFSRVAADQPGAVKLVAFGRYVAPDYMVHPGEYIPAIGTSTGVPQRQGPNTIHFTLLIPDTAKPANGWPVAIVGHGGNGNKDASVFFYAAELAKRGIATIGINAVGRGRGRLGTLSIELTSGQTVTFASGGRGIDQNGDGTITTNEGSAALPPRQLSSETDGNRQSVVDWMQLVRVIAEGVDVDGDGSRDLDPDRIGIEGASFSGGLGMVLLAVDDRIQVGTLCVPGGGSGRIDLLRLRPAGRGPVSGAALAARQPSLINANGLTSLDGVPVTAPFFNENLPFRNEPPRVNDVPGAFEIQEIFERAEWASQLGDATSHAPYLRRSPLAGNSRKSILIQIAKGDQTAPTPRTSATIRAGNLQDVTVYYRHDLAYAEDPSIARNPHSFLLTIASPTITGLVARGAQNQAATFLESRGARIIHPEPARFFEVTIAQLPERLEFIR